MQVFRRLPASTARRCILIGVKANLSGRAQGDAAGRRRAPVVQRQDRCITGIFTFSSGLVRTTLQLLVPLFLAGCLASEVPLIQSGAGDDVGKVLAFRIYQPPGAEPGDRVRFVRDRDHEYRLELSESGSEGPSLSPNVTVANKILLKRMGKRDGNPVYLIQFDRAGLRTGMGVSDDGSTPRYQALLFSVNRSGVGTAALIECKSPSVRELAAAHGIDLRCADRTAPYNSRIANTPTGRQIRAFLTALVASGTLEWEDTRKTSLFEGID